MSSIFFLFYPCFRPSLFFLFFFNDTATTEIYPLSLHDALPISCSWACMRGSVAAFSPASPAHRGSDAGENAATERSEEHTSELQSRPHLVCRLLLEKKKQASS